jgi:tRNA1(Val) A37 N6-methylase TrmN6
MDRSAIRAKFGDDYIATERTFMLGIDIRFASRIAERFRDRTVLETCTGGGFTTIALAQVAAHVVTIEIEPDHQLQARANLAKAGLEKKVTFLDGDALDAGLLGKAAGIDSAFLDPDWARSGPNHVYKFRPSNTRPPADALLETMLAKTPDVALILPPQVDLRELEGLPPHELQRLFFAGSHELYCLYFGALARSSTPTEMRL